MTNEVIESSQFTTLQVEDLIKKAQAGDVQALSAVVTSHQKLIYKVVHSQFKKLAIIYNRASNSTLEVEDLFSIAQSALILAIHAFSPTKNLSFTSFAAYKIKFELFNQVKKLQGPFRLPVHIFSKKKRLLEKKEGADPPWSRASSFAVSTPYSSCQLSPQLKDDNGTNLYELYREELLDQIRTVFTSKYRDVLALKIDGYSCKEIGALLGISQKQASRIFRRIIGEAHNLDELDERLANLAKSRGGDHVHRQKS